MAIAFSCPNCHTPLKVKDDLAGKKVHCKDCKQPMRVPAANRHDHHADELAHAALSDEPAPSSNGTVAADDTYQAECPNCLETVAFPYKMAGKQAQCSACKRVVRVPQPAEDDRKKDWRAAAVKPEAARRDTEHLEGAWGNATHGTIASRDALLEAAVIKSRKDRDLTLGQKLTRWTIAVSAVALLAVGFMLWRNARFESMRDGFIDKALALRETGDDVKLPFVNAEVSRAAAEYQLRGRTPNADKARKLAQAATVFPANDAPENVLERTLALADVAVLSCELGGEGRAVRDGSKLSWEEALKDVRRAFQTLGRGDALSREGAILAIGRASAKLGVSPGGARPDGFTLANFAFDGGDLRDLTEARAAAALELLPVDAARGKIDEFAANLGTTTDSPRAIALLVATRKPAAVPLPTTGEPPFAVRVGYAEGLARLGELDSARKVAALPGRFEDRFAAAVAVAAGGGKPEDAQAAVELLDKELGGRDLPEWPVLRLSQVCAALPEPGPGRALATLLTANAAATPRLQVVRAWSIGQQMRAGHVPGDESAVKALTPATSAGALLAWEALARRLAANGSPAAVDGWPVGARALGFVGTGLGLQDRK